MQNITDLLPPVVCAFIIGAVPICAKYIAWQTCKSVEVKLDQFRNQTMVGQENLRVRVEYLEKHLEGCPLLASHQQQQHGD